MNDFATSYAAIVKSEKQEDGSLMVYGKATDDSIDLDQQICDEAWLKTAMPQWFQSGGNIREQHSNIAAGVAKEYEAKTDGHYITAHVVDPVSVKKVEAGVLKGFSIGIKAPRVIRDNKAAGGRIVDGQIIEVSLVDRPANPNAKLIMAKSVEGESTLVQVEELHEFNAPLPSEVFKREVSDEERSRLAEQGQAMPDGSYPIANVSDLKNAIQAFGRAKNPAAVKKHIIRRARALNAIDQLPEEWNVKKADDLVNAVKALDADTVKFDQATFDAARRAVAQLIIVEANEMAEGDDETNSLNQLVEVANHLIAWYQGEIQEGETSMSDIELSAHKDPEPDSTMGCKCDGCMKCAADGGCDAKMCKSHAAEKSASEKCLECGCHIPDDAHGRDDVTTAEMKSADADETTEEVAEPATEVAAETEVSEDAVESESTEKTLVSDDVLNIIIEKAVKNATDSVKAEIDLLKSATEAAEQKSLALEQELAIVKSLPAQGPKRTAVQQGTNNDDAIIAKAAEYQAKAARTTDPVLAEGFREMASLILKKSAQDNSDKE